MGVGTRLRRSDLNAYSPLHEAIIDFLCGEIDPALRSNARKLLADMKLTNPETR
jgi:hypothetical protein